jgi:RNA polymerase sigma-70 factor (sigma-E family)
MAGSAEADAPGAQLSDGPDAALGVDALCRAQWQPMVRLAYLLCGDREAAEDVVQDALLALTRRWDRLRSPDAATAYLRVSVVNGARSVVRRRITARRLGVLGDGAVEAAERTALRNDEHRRVIDMIRGLPRRQREVVVLRYWAGLSEAEIAATLRVSAGTVKSAASRARAAIELGLEDADGR